MSSSPFEKVSLPNAMSSSASTVTPRKLPPPYDPASLPAKVGRMSVNDDHISRERNETPPPPPPPRRQTAGISPPTTVMGTGLNRTQTQPLPPPLRPASAASQSSSQASQHLKNGKSPPPIAKKPAHLAAAVSPPRNVANGGTSNGTAHDDDDFRPPLPVRASTGLTSSSPHQQLGPNVLRKPIPPKPAINVASLKGTISPISVSSVKGVGLPGMTGADGRAMPQPRRVLPPKPQLQQQPPLQPQPQSHNNLDLLDSLDESHEMGGWETLKPSTKT